MQENARVPEWRRGAGATIIRDSKTHHIAFCAPKLGYPNRLWCCSSTLVFGVLHSPERNMGRFLLRRLQYSMPDKLAACQACSCDLDFSLRTIVYRLFAITRTGSLRVTAAAAQHGRLFHGWTVLRLASLRRCPLCTFILRPSWLLLNIPLPLIFESVHQTRCFAAWITNLTVGNRACFHMTCRGLILSVILLESLAQALSSHLPFADFTGL